ncbi:MAG TPA: magnesium-translocating P-type ATPase [Polyangiaceae bacterium]
MSTQGLSGAEAARRLESDGPNEPTPAGERSRVAEIVALVLNPLAAILLFASVLSAIVGDRVGAAIIFMMVVIGAAIDFTQTYRSQVAARKLRERVAPTATVMRDGQWREIARREVVRGDACRLSAGDLVPADARLVEARDLHTQEAALTGESFPVEKVAGALVLLGTSVVSGTGTAIVEETGAKTQFGGVAARLATTPPPTEFDRGLRRFGFLIMRVVVFLVLFVFVVDVALKRDAMQSLLFAIALAVGLTPEFLPMITSVTLAKGAVALAREKVIVKHLSAMQNLGSIDVLCSDKTGTLTSGVMTVARSVDASGRDASRPAELAAMNAAFETGIRSPLDSALLEHDARAADGWKKLDEVPFDFERRRISIVAQKDGERWLVSKGAPEALCALASAGPGAREMYEALGAQGHRVLAVAARRVEEKTAYDKTDEHDLELVGFVAFSDPPLADARRAVRALQADGVTVKVLTGDSEAVTRHVCSAVGLGGDRIVLGEEIARMSESALEHVVETANVFARVTPAQKNQIVLALKRRSHVVGFLGDGINDAPSLHAADVGISVANAVDVARGAADVILLERGLRVLHAGIVHGRRAFGNVTKYLLMGTSSNFGNMLSMAGAAVLLPFLPMTPTQILLNNLLYDLAQITIPTDNVDRAYLRRPQRWNISFVRRFMIAIGPLSSIYDFVTFFVLARVFHAPERLFHTGWFVESIATQTLVIFVIRTFGSPLRSKPSAALAATALLVVAVSCILPMTPLARFLGFEPLPLGYFAFVAVATVTYLGLVEALKRKLVGTHGLQPRAPLAASAAGAA